MTSGKRAALIVVPVVAIAIALAGAFALLPQPAGDSENADNNPTADGNASAGNITSVESCNAVSGRVRSILASIEGIETEETRNASASLVDEYCKRAQLVPEISAMTSPAVGLVAYGCDAGSGRLGDSELQRWLEGYATIYCDNAFVTIFEVSEFILVDVDQYREDLATDLEEGDGGSDNATSTINTEEVEAKLQEIADLAKKAKSLLRSDKYYDAAKAYDSASKMLDQLASSH
ncbi:MAG: hypothetical protein ACREAQ_07770 [Nitrososphaera sp.]